MHVTLVHVRVNPENVDDFIATTRANHQSSINEPGNRRVDVLQNPDDPTRFVLYEAYVSVARVRQLILQAVVCYRPALKNVYYKRESCCG